MENNFKDPETGEEFLINNYKIKVVTGRTIYMDQKTNQLIKNPKNGNFLIPIKKEGEIGAPMLGKTNNKESLQKMLKKRSKDHFKKEIEEVKMEKLKKLKDN